MMLLEQLAMSFTASAAFGILFNSPRDRLLQCGITGMAGWLVYVYAMRLTLDAIPATLLAAIAVTALSQLFSKLYRTPIIVFSVSGIIPLVPGGVAYDAMRNAVQDNYELAVELAVKAFMLSGAIAIGLFFSEVLNRMIRSFGNKP
ncbi:threonine/serine exporter family protein [Paenibacillus sp. N4]|uniref:threonine/serine exporter family protein n=1 Tax=Paenibacillus vietnamensis TaxID=2590547 RepID=UPI001CD0AD84|nr:threonine/serine exporter family protein [Paenibacillus vietnamensis]MCA0754837.1 threonine/serine exporter family protein [Paenibacillus vietnamensis]